MKTQFLNSSKNTILNKKNLYLSTFLILILFLSACSGKLKKSDAYGNFLAKEIIISSESSGKIVKMNVEKGDILSKNQEIAITDTTILNLQKKTLFSKKKSIQTQFSSIIAKVEVLKEQKSVLEIEKQRITNLLKDSAATQQQLENIVGKINVIDKQILEIKTHNSSIFAQLEPVDVQIDILDKQIKRSTILSPVSGTILEKYAESGEITTVGKPLVKIADLTKMELTVYVSGSQLSKIKIGQTVEVLIDKDDTDFTKLSGTIAWISEKAEFTPKIIQTKKERVNLVYAVKIFVDNDGSIKIGMPAEVNF